jgi:hypothetical protein
MTKKELHEGVSGNGQTIWIVATVNEQGQWIWQEQFKNKKEAQSWIKYA